MDFCGDGMGGGHSCLGVAQCTRKGSSVEWKKEVRTSYGILCALRGHGSVVLSRQLLNVGWGTQTKHRHASLRITACNSSLVCLYKTGVPHRAVPASLLYR